MECILLWLLWEVPVGPRRIRRWDRGIVRSEQIVPCCIGLKELNQGRIRLALNTKTAKWQSRHPHLCKDADIQPHRNDCILGAPAFPPAIISLRHKMAMLHYLIQDICIGGIRLPICFQHHKKIKSEQSQILSAAILFFLTYCKISKYSPLLHRQFAKKTTNLSCWLLGLEFSSFKPLGKTHLFNEALGLVLVSYWNEACYLEEQNAYSSAACPPPYLPSLPLLFLKT